MQTIEQIDISKLSPKVFMHEFQRRSVPVVINGLQTNRSMFDLHSLKTVLAGETVYTRAYGADRFDIPKSEWRDYCDFRAMTFSEYAQLLESGVAAHDRIYLAQHDISKTQLCAPINGLFSAISSKSGLSPLSQMNLWLGPGGHTEPLHFDIGDGTLVQLQGSKRVALFAPQESRNLYPFPFGEGPIPPSFSRVYIDSPDAKVFPRLGKALKAKISVTLEDGEMLYIPAYWWHEVTALGNSYVCSVNRFWKVQPYRRNFVTSRSSTTYLLSRPMGRRFAKSLFSLKSYVSS